MGIVRFIPLRTPCTLPKVPQGRLVELFRRSFCLRLPRPPLAESGVSLGQFVHLEEGLLKHDLGEIVLARLLDGSHHQRHRIIAGREAFGYDSMAFPDVRVWGCFRQSMRPPYWGQR